ncbi:hypothetical protein U1Q18_012410, partial [Sarracenia purpurea var. burkii]
EARAAWQKIANRCFVQEDAKRAPKLACAPQHLHRPNRLILDLQMRQMGTIIPV